MSQGNYRVLALVLAGLFLGYTGCGGGGSSTTSGDTLPQVSAPPVATLEGWTPADSTLLQYKAYTFSASANDPNIGGSITEFHWDFGDGTRRVLPSVLANGRATSATTYSYVAAGAPTLSVRARNGAGLFSAAVTRGLTVIAAPSPLTVAFTAPTGPVSINAAMGSGYALTFQIRVTNSGAGTINAGGILLNPGDPTATQAAPVDLGNGDWRIVVTYPGAAVVGTRTATPSVQVVDSNGVSSAPVTGPVVTIKTVSLSNDSPTITITSPSTPTASAYTSKPITLAFTLTDSNGDPVTYSVDWGDGSPVASGTPTGNWVTGVSVSLNHVYADGFTATTRDALVTVSATDNGPTNPQATPQTRTFNVVFNTLPTATITSPQDSGTAPAGYTPTTLPADTVVVPLNGKLSFAGSSTKPGSQDNVTSSWTFPGGAPGTFSGDRPGDVIFAGTAGVITPVTVTYRVADTFGRAATRTKTVLIDGVNVQQFNLSFQHRQKSDNNGAPVLAPAITAANGLGALVQIFQDGQISTYPVQNQTQLVGAKAQVSVPVRSDLPFYIKIPGFGTDDTTYLMRIPNAPTGPFADPSLEATSTADSRFSFQNPSVPFNPTLQIVTTQGFSAESTLAPERKLSGLTDLVIGASPAPANERWLDRLSVPANDPTGALQWVQSSNAAATLSGVPAYQLFAEWPTLILTRKTTDLGEGNLEPSTTAGKSSDLGFVLDYPAYVADSKKGESFAAFSLQTFRVPPGATDPYQLSPAWQTSFTAPGSPFAAYNSTYYITYDINGVPTVNDVPSAGLNPLQVSTGVRDFFQNLVNGVPGSTPLAGGIAGLTLPYDPNDPDRLPLVAASTRSFANIRSVFAYSEYLWSTVWARPLVLNHARPAFYQSGALGSFDQFRYSNPLAWPKMVQISPDNSSFDLTVHGGGVFDASAPVAINGAPAPSTGVGRFFWTAYTPFYAGEGNTGAVVSRTWLSDEGTKQPPTSFPAAAAAGDATSAFGLMTPQDTMVDKRKRNPDGSLEGNPLGGYRVVWFNPTKDANGGTVAPDFWVVELVQGTSKTHFMLPANYPASAQTAAALILTDARTYLPSGNAPTAGPAAGDKVAPGYCWFDIPVELRPTAAASLTVYGLKSILKNNPASGSRPLNRPDWMDALKTATARVKVLAASGRDLSYIHKIPFNFYWDIVVVNGPTTVVAP